MKEPIIVHEVATTRLQGQILGPGDIPLVNARVELPGLRHTTYTDMEGRFSFATVPETSGSRVLRVAAKGREFNIVTNRPAPDEPFVIHVAFTEE